MPDTNLSISALTPKDREDLEFATKYGDLVSLSFVRRPEDVAELIRELDCLGATQTEIILKIENRAAVESLPRILLTAMGRPAVTAVMVARGDLGVRVLQKCFLDKLPPRCSEADYTVSPIGRMRVTPD